MLGVPSALLRGCVAYTADFLIARYDMDHSVLSRWRDGSSLSGLLCYLLAWMALCVFGKELPEVSFLKKFVDLDLHCDAVLRFVTVVMVEVAPETRVPERIGCFHLLRPLDLLAHLPQNIDQLWP